VQVSCRMRSNQRFVRGERHVHQQSRSTDHRALAQGLRRASRGRIARCRYRGLRPCRTGAHHPWCRRLERIARGRRTRHRAQLARPCGGLHRKPSPGRASGACTGRRGARRPVTGEPGQHRDPGPRARGLSQGRHVGRRGRPRLPHRLGAAGRHRARREQPRALRRQPAGRGGCGPTGHHRHPAGRHERDRPDHRQRPRPPGPGHRLRPSRGPDAVHPQHLGGGGRRRRS